MGRWIFHRPGGSVPGLTAGCGHTTRAVAIATRPSGCSRREREMGDHDTDGCCRMDWNFLWNYCFCSIKIRTMRTSKFYHIGIMTKPDFLVLLLCETGDNRTGFWCNSWNCSFLLKKANVVDKYSKGQKFKHTSSFNAFSRLVDLRFLK